MEEKKVLETDKRKVENALNKAKEELDRLEL